MLLSKLQAYLFFVYCFLCLVFLCQSIWLFSDVVNSQIIGFTDKRRRSKEIEFVNVRYQVDGRNYTTTLMKMNLAHDIKNVEIRYLKFLPGIARENSFVGIWGVALIVFALFFSVISIIFLRKDIIKKGSKFQILSHNPFVRLIKS